jgi:MFS transporter, DHA2 family, multidrug resistance protein
MTAPSTAEASNASNRTVITICVMAATLMQTLDTTIVNVAMPYIQGSLAASPDQITWILTSYIVAAAIMTPPVGWLSARFGRKNLFLASLAGFTLASILCGAAESLPKSYCFALYKVCSVRRLCLYRKQPCSTSFRPRSAARRWRSGLWAS